MEDFEMKIIVLWMAWLMALCPTVFAKEAAKAENTQTRITASQALESARKVVTGKEWLLAFLSNTGVTDSVTSEQFNGPEEGLMLPDGRAGQWVVEFFKDTPTTVSEGGRTGKSYPFRRVLVTATKSGMLPELDLAVPQNLSVLKEEYVAALETARKLATSQVKAKYDIMSVESLVKSDGQCSWVFRFYDLKTQKIAAVITTTGDGRKVIK